MRRMFTFPFWLVPLGFVLVLMAVFAVGPMSSTRPGGALAPIGVIIVVGIVVFAVVVWQRTVQKRTDKTRIGETRMVIHGQLDAIANDILNLEGEVRAAGNDEPLIQYRNATTTYAGVLGELETADTAAELTDLATRLDVAIWQLDVTEALLDGNPLPVKPHTEPAAASATGRPGYQRRAGRGSCIGVADMIAAMLDGGSMPRGTRGRGPRRAMGMGLMRMGPLGMMGMMGDDREQDRTRDEDALSVLRGRYAAGELTDEEFDAKRRRLEGR
ncbi:MAG: SHOCT domain-containing protein [Acidobacteria bacterium]|nr:SHOCT domain-containing protein [Acidobacteriota bacterium]